MNKFIKILFITIVITSCTTKNNNDINLFNKVYFKTLEKESVVPSTDSKYSDRYYLYIDNPNFQIPLYRCIKSKDYIIYIGIPYNTSIKEIISNKNIERDHLICDKDTTKFFYHQNKQGQEYYTEYSKQVDNNLIYILSITNAKTVADSLFEYKPISERLKFEKE